MSHLLEFLGSFGIRVVKRMNLPAGSREQVSEASIMLAMRKKVLGRGEVPADSLGNFTGTPIRLFPPDLSISDERSAQRLYQSLRGSTSRCRSNPGTSRRLP